jgi:hypothetical protein
MKVMIYKKFSYPLIKPDKSIFITHDYQAFDVNNILYDVSNVEIYTDVNSPAYAMFISSYFHNLTYYIYKERHALPMKIPKVKVIYQEMPKDRKIIFIGHDGVSRVTTELVMKRSVDVIEPDLRIEKLPNYRDSIILFTPTEPSLVLRTIELKDKYNLQIYFVIPIVDEKNPNPLFSCTFQGSKLDKVREVKIMMVK